MKKVSMGRAILSLADHLAGEPWLMCLGHNQREIFLYTKRRRLPLIGQLLKQDGWKDFPVQVKYIGQVKPA